MKATDLPGIPGLITNSLALNREITRAVNFIVVYRSRSGVEPAAAAALKAVFQAAIDKIDEGEIV